MSDRPIGGPVEDVSRDELAEVARNPENELAVLIVRKAADEIPRIYVAPVGAEGVDLLSMLSLATQKIPDARYRSYR